MKPFKMLKAKRLRFDLVHGTLFFPPYKSTYASEKGSITLTGTVGHTVAACTHNVLFFPALVVGLEPRDDLEEYDSEAVDVDGRAEVA